MNIWLNGYPTEMVQWLPRIRQFNLKPSEYVFNGIICKMKYAGPQYIDDQTYKNSRDNTLKQMQYARGLGMKAMPGLVAHISFPYTGGEGYPNWYNKDEWANRARMFKQACEIADPTNPMVMLDIEPYASWWPDFKLEWWRDIPRIMEAMSPLVEEILKFPGQVWVAPGDEKTYIGDILTNWVKGRVKFIKAEEQPSYDIVNKLMVDTDDTSVYEYWKAHLLRRRDQCSHAGVGYVPGIFAQAIKTQQKTFFWALENDIKFTDCWLFLNNYSTVINGVTKTERDRFLTREWLAS